jgi:hypothetical protein
MKKFNCSKCNSTEVFIEQNGNNIGLYCADCGKWIKWLNKDELRLAERQIKEYDKEIRAKAIDEFAEMLKEKYEEHNFDLCLRQNDYYSYSNSCMLFESYIDEIAEQLKAGEKK